MRYGVVVLMACLAGCSASVSTARLDPEDEGAPAKKEKKDRPKGKKAKAEKAAPFRLPADDAGKRLAEVLPPTKAEGRLRNPGRPVAKPFPAPTFTGPEEELPFTSPVPPGLPPSKAKTKRYPRIVAEEPVELPGRIEVPARPTFDAGKRAKIKSRDVSIPLPLPLIATPLPDRVSLEDATMEASTAAVLSAALPWRTTPAPNLRLRLPDPFEFRLPLTIKVPAEETAPVSRRPEVPK